MKFVQTQIERIAGGMQIMNLLQLESFYQENQSWSWWDGGFSRSRSLNAEHNVFYMKWNTELFCVDPLNEGVSLKGMENSSFLLPAARATNHKFELLRLYVGVSHFGMNLPNSLFSRRFYAYVSSSTFMSIRIRFSKFLKYLTHEQTQ